MTLDDLILVVVALIVGGICVALVGRTFKALVIAVTKQEAAGRFFLRALVITVLFGVLSAAIGGGFTVSEEDGIMEYVWNVAGALEGVFWSICWLLLAYAAMATVLLAALGRRNEQ